jgi:hypothetical protein
MRSAGALVVPFGSHVKQASADHRAHRHVLPS